MSRRRDERKVEAQERDEARVARTSEGQLAVLDSRLGKSMGAERERLRLLREIEKRDATTKAKAKVTTKAKVKETATSRSKPKVDRKKAKERRNADRERTGRGDHK
jgi:hypothetical protein